MTNVHKVFVSYHHANDESYKREFERICKDVTIFQSVNIGDINTNNKTETIRQIIRDDYLSDSSVTVVLIGRQTWQRKHVDWEIGSSIRATQKNPRSGLIGIYLPTHPDYKREKYSKYKIPPRLWDNVEKGYAKLYDWTNNATIIQQWIHEAYLRKSKINPTNSREQYVNNKSGDQWQ